ncbi:CapA family protein [Natronosporangium hydrolyticum]|uniref:CapA family protein n=1 Tax=Natronosporangium hydrolyticum TaxID=2811111 RepID=A0A895YI90_9ACTN|nr:CapA family protein [Natronosporangium hydrolyticum]QSB15249.1 CapA family protein [Natronosporangium hydrolyticum]
MEISLTRVRAVRYQMPLKRAYGTARGVTTAGVNFLLVLGAEGSGQPFEGLGECQPRHALTGDGGKDRVSAWQFLCAATDALAGRRLRFDGPAEAVASVRSAMAELNPIAVAHAEEQDRDRPFRGTLLGIETALLDVVSHALGIQLADLLGRQRDDIGISISTISSSNDLAQVKEKTIKQVRFPMTRVKGTGDIAYDLSLLGVVTEANRSVGRERPIWIDINEALDYDGAVRLLTEIADRMGRGELPASIVVEGMLPKRDVDQLPQLQRVADERCQALGSDQPLDLRVMPDEGMWDVDDLTRLNALGGCRAINIKAPKAGGLLASLDLANAAVAADPEVHVCIGGMVGTSDVTAWALHSLARALPRVDYLTTVPPQNVQERISEPLAKYHAKDSNIIARQTTPGLGTRLRWDKLAPYVEATYEAATAAAGPLAQVDGPEPEPISASELPDLSGVAFKTLVFGGDTSLGDVYVDRAGGSLRHRLDENPMSFVADLQPLVADHDALILNLETVLADHPVSPFEGDKPYLGWDSPQRTIDCLTRLGVDAVSLANNHTMDYGAEHLLATKQQLEAAGIQAFGAGASGAEAAEPLTLRLDFDGVERRVHVIGAMQIQAKLRDQYQFYAGSRQPGVHSMAIQRVATAITELRRTDPSSLIVVFPHWGRNYQWVNEAQQRAAAAFVDAGADLIIGHGAHMLQQCSFGRQHAVVYSLGNFQFNWGGRFDKHDAPPYGLVARVNAGVRAGGWVVDLRLYPITSDNRATNHRPSPVDEASFEALWSALVSHDLDHSFQRLAHRGRDEYGFYLGYAFTTAAVTPTTDPGANGENVYDDPESTALLRMLDQRLLPSLLIAKEAELDGASIDWLASDTFVASLGEQRLLFKGNRCLESVPATKVVRDKGILKRLLNDAGVSTAPGGVAQSLADAEDLFRTLDGPVVVKPAMGDRGAGVSVNVTDIDHLRAAYDRADAEGGVLVERFVAGTEFRCVATNHECVAVCGRDAPNVIGDGVHTIAQLIDTKNQRRRRNPHLQNRPIRVNDNLDTLLSRAGLSLASIPGKDDKVYVGGAANFSVGGDSIDYSDEVPEVLKQTAVAAVKAVPGLNWGGVDAILRPGQDGDREEVYVLEINVNAGIGGFHYPLYGRPRNLARSIWQLRRGRVADFGAEQRTVGDGIGKAGRRPGTMSPTAFAHRDASATVTIKDLLSDYLTTGKVAYEDLAPDLRRLAGDQDQLIFGCAGTADLSLVAQVINRRGQLRRLLRLAEIRIPKGQPVSSVVDLSARLAQFDTPVALLPARGGAGWRAGTVLAPSAGPDEINAAWDGLADEAGFLQSRRPGLRVRVLATDREAYAFVLPAGTAAALLTPEVVPSLARSAAQAVRAIPELRWAAVDLLAPVRTAGGLNAQRVTVEGLTTTPTFSPDDQVVAGSIAGFFDAVLPAGFVRRRPQPRRLRMPWQRTSADRVTGTDRS